MSWDGLVSARIDGVLLGIPQPRVTAVTLG